MVIGMRKVLDEDGEPALLVETKLSDRQAAAPLMRFQKRLQVPAVQLIHEGEGYRLRSNAGQKLLVAPAWQWIPFLP